jgi:signal transduction histidine kinase
MVLSPLEEELCAALDHLANRVRQCTDQWAELNDRLAEAMKAGGEARIAKSMFVANAGHELRLPLTPVLLGISMLQSKSDLEPDTRALLQMMRSNVETRRG